MNEFPDTRQSLLVLVKDPTNREAWEQFADLYRPVIFRIAIARGLQDADAHDLSQQVLMSVAGAIGDWQQRDESTRFRHWLSRVTKNAILNSLMRQPKDRPVGGSSAENILLDVADVDGSTSQLIEREYRRELYLRAAKKVQTSVTADTWRAFEMTLQEDVSIEQVAALLDRSVGSIYTARSRVMLRLRDAVSQLEADDQ